MRRWDDLRFRYRYDCHRPSCEMILYTSLVLGAIALYGTLILGAELGEHYGKNHPDPKSTEEGCYNTLMMANSLFEGLNHGFNVSQAKEVICSSIRP